MNYKFFQFGTCSTHYPFIEEKQIDLNENTMTDVLRKEKIDCAVLWSIIPETYSYTFFEAYSANCYILTNEFSGNIAIKVAEINNGYIAHNANELESILDNDIELAALINKFKTSNNYGPKSLITNMDVLNLLNAKREFKARGTNACTGNFLKEKIILACYSTVKILKGKTKGRL